MTFESPREVIVKKYMDEYYWHGGVYRAWFRLWKYNRDIGMASFFFFFGMAAGNLEEPANNALEWVCAIFFIAGIIFGIAATVDYIVQRALIDKAFNATNAHFKYREDPLMSRDKFDSIIHSLGYSHEK